MLREAGDDPYALVVRFDAVTESAIVPWYRAQIATDRARFAEMRALAEGREPPQPTDDLARQCLALFFCMAADPDLFRAALEYIGTLTPLQEVLRRPDVIARLAAATEAQRAAGPPPPPLPGPNRAQLLALLA